MNDTLGKQLDARNVTRSNCKYQETVVDFVFTALSAQTVNIVPQEYEIYIHLYSQQKATP